VDEDLNLISLLCTSSYCSQVPSFNILSDSYNFRMGPDGGPDRGPNRFDSLRCGLLERRRKRIHS
jgi:hypothetical protein